MVGRKSNFTFSDGSSIQTYTFRVPQIIPEPLMKAFVTLVVAAHEKYPKHKNNLAFLRRAIAKPEEQSGTPIYLTHDDIEVANAASIGFVAYKLGLRQSPSQPKGEETSQLRSQILNALNGV